MRNLKTIHPPHLKSVVKKITVITEENGNSTINAMRYFADELAGIMFQQSNHNIFLNMGKRKLSRVIRLK